MGVDWNACEQQLYAASLAAIQRFAQEHPSEEICFFCYDSEPRYGYVFIGFDTLENNVRSAMGLQRFAVDNRERNLQGALTWQWAQYQLSTPVLQPFLTNSGDFAYREYAQVDFPADYLGESFTYTGKTSVAHNGVFTDGNVDF